jgi:hypothetical protein
MDDAGIPPPPPQSHSELSDASQSRQDTFLPPGPLRSPRKISPSCFEQADLPSAGITNESLRSLLAINASKRQASTPSPLLRDGSSVPPLNLSGLASGRQSPASSIASCSPRGYDPTRRPSGGAGMIPPYLKSSSGSAHNLLEQADIPSPDSQNEELSVVLQKFGSPSSECSQSAASTKTASPLVIDQEIDRIKRSPLKSDSGHLGSSPLISEHRNVLHYVRKASPMTGAVVGGRDEMTPSFAMSATGSDSTLKDPNRSKKIKESMNILRDHS